MLDAGIYEQLSRLVIAVKQKSSQNMAGNRRSVQKGTSAEFSDFREYMPGDDLRRLDWNVYARSERMPRGITSTASALRMKGDWMRRDSRQPL